MKSPTTKTSAAADDDDPKDTKTGAKADQGAKTDGSQQVKTAEVGAKTEDGAEITNAAGSTSTDVNTTAKTDAGSTFEGSRPAGPDTLTNAEAADGFTADAPAGDATSDLGGANPGAAFPGGGVKAHYDVTGALIPDAKPTVITHSAGDTINGRKITAVKREGGQELVMFEGEKDWAKADAYSAG